MISKGNVPELLAVHFSLTPPTFARIMQEKKHEPKLQKKGVQGEKNAGKYMNASAI